MSDHATADDQEADASFEGHAEERPRVSAEPFVRKAEKIALHLHHHNLRIAHLLLAVAISPSAQEYFKLHDLDADVVRRCCWRALEDVPPQPDIARDVPPSQEINELFGHAASFSNGQELEVWHLLRAVNDAKLIGQYGPLLRNPGPRAEDVDAKISEVRSRLAEGLPGIAGRLSAIENVQADIRDTVSTLRESVGNRVRERDLHTALDVLRGYTTTLKYIVIIAALSLAFVSAMIRVVGGP